MISTESAVALRDAGLVWHPRSGDRFQLDEPEFEADVFTVSEMTIEPREYSTGRILSFNGTTEWALDSVALEDALWLPSESQLRELLRGAFRTLRRLPDTHEVEIVLNRPEQPQEQEVLVFQHPEPADAYAMAVLELLRRIA
ncbi:pilus assembly protein CpaE [Microbacterium sp. zg.B48]|uniref:pilus assembly protein CpaE n=1 Tax=Microbacterium sp. zg.B48 TaxID=2969408 RepID=UPI00214C1666|nr:pilus assembly protein CpaE [Microbacterium sp. zg.B48]MCR2762406.1 pilus assembly protein CpaE [Microbacterium sp. zg.B48]